MIGYLVGTVERVSEKEVLVLTSGGVGYPIFPAGSLLAKCKKGQAIKADIFTVVREQEISLYGFGDVKEKELFQKLLSVSGIGPKIALQIVSTPVDQFLQAVENGEVDFLTKIPGLGKKTAERLIVELRGKLNLSADADLGPISPSLAEATDALQNLGYDRHTVNLVLKKAPEQASTEELVKFFLTSNA